MTVAELIVKLQELDQDREVGVVGTCECCTEHIPFIDDEDKYEVANVIDRLLEGTEEVDKDSKLLWPYAGIIFSG